ncbi:MAG TPA: glycoside hydrolase family 2 TIM barrel-domain containing protein, partial [Clostridia bacterium]|nr:glycoside hydrolase family 2 TIM barrel-domain containing protein [Clostridia bacterium]
MVKGDSDLSTAPGVVRLVVQALRLAGFLGVLLVSAGAATADRIHFTLPFAPAEGWVKPQEAPFRAELCLNGSWHFQPVAVPREFKPGVGVPPELPAPDPGKWDPTPLKVPSPWNVNTWGCGRDVGAGTRRPYWPDSVYYPSYPAAWDEVQMGWLRRSFQVPAEWTGRRIVLHFEAVAGDCEVRINGRKAGSHFDKYLPFDLDITELVNRDQANELLVGIRAHALFDKRSERFAKMTAPYPCGSETDKLIGLWQDVYLLALPETHIEDVFVKPLVSQDALELEVTIRNDSIRAQKVLLEGEIFPWQNLAATDVLSAPEPKWRLDKAVLRLTTRTVTVQSGSTAKITLHEPVRGRFNSWKPGSPHLYAAILSLKENGQPADRRFTRFGWREFSIRGKDLLLNGERIQLYGDLLHPFGPLTMSRRHTWAWYRFIQDFGGNAVRPHAQIHPRHYLELADEMGIVVLDESALFGSSIRLNFEEPAAWQRFKDHCDGLVLRDRNHPSVLGWSFGNELFAIFNLNSVPEDLARNWYQKLAEIGARVKDLDPTRPWISCDGDEDLRGTLPVWSKHFGHGTPLDRLPELNKPLMVGESGGTYYARPRQLAEFNGPAAFESYAKRNEALAIDVYDNIVRMARPHLAWYSASETAWFGTEHLSFGYRDFSRLPGLRDGVFFSRPHVESTPGMQPERLPPFVATLNPGWDPSLPLYQPLAMFHAQKAALAKQGPLPSPWDHKPSPAPASLLVPTPLYSQATLLADPVGVLGRRLSKLGIPFGPSSRASEPGFTIIDADTLTAETLPRARTALDRLAADGGLVLMLLGTGRAKPDQLATLLPAATRVT